MLDFGNRRDRRRARPSPLARSRIYNVRRPPIRSPEHRIEALVVSHSEKADHYTHFFVCKMVAHPALLRRTRLPALDEDKGRSYIKLSRKGFA